MARDTTRTVHDDDALYVDGDVRELSFFKDEANADVRSIEQMREEEPHEDGILVTVTPHEEQGGWSVCWSASGDPHGGGTTCTGLSASKNAGHPAPEVGQRIRVYGSFGRPVTGMDIDGVPRWFHTPYERFAARIKMLRRVRP